MTAPLLSQRRDAWLVAILAQLVTPHELETLLHDHPTDLWRAADDAGLLSPSALLDAIARRTHLPIATDFPLSDALRAVLPESSARRFHVVPTAVSAHTLTIASSTPYNLTCDQYLAFTTRRTIRVTLASPRTIDAQLDALYQPHRDIERLLASIATEHQVVPLLSNTNDRDDADDTFTPDDRPIIKLVDAMLAAAITARASDVHLEPHEMGVEVRHRIDGMLHHALTLPKRIALPLISRFKVMGRMDIADRVRPQDGHTRIALNGTPMDLRLSTLPASQGEKLVVRLLDPSATLRPLDALGFTPSDTTRLRLLLDTREGLILMTGPTGSGKTTTLYSALNVLRQRRLNIVTVEDPVEYRIPGIVQVQVNPKAGLTFASALKSILRQDPDVILIGEIRDHETAAIAIQAALTGHLVFATLHTLDAASSITRLHDLGVALTKIASALKGVIAQRLLRRCCSCRISAAHTGWPNAADITSPDTRDTNGAATFCDRCSHTGYHGRVAAAEIVLTNAAIQRHIACADPATVLLAAIRESGTLSLWTSALLHVDAGLTTLDEVHRAIEPDVPPETGSENEDGRAQRPRADSRSPTQPPKPPRRGGATPFDDPEDDRGNEAHGSDDHDPGVARGARYEGGTGSSFRPHTLPMTHIVAGLVDVYVVDPSQPTWHALLLQRAPGTRSPGSWEAVHGKIDPEETPEQAAVREVREETGLEIHRLYNVMVQPFYLHHSNTVQLAIVFCAFADRKNPVVRSEEHQAYQWLSMGEAVNKYTWPRAIQALRSIEKLLSTGDAGPAEDVMRVL